MAFKLVATEQFQSYLKGQEITDPDAIAAILESASSVNVVKVDIPDRDASTPPPLPETTLDLHVE